MAVALRRIVEAGGGQVRPTRGRAEMRRLLVRALPQRRQQRQVEFQTTRCQERTVA